MTEIMRRSASDNQYLHKDFHGALSNGIEYLHRNFGEEAVREYLHDFTRSYYAALIDDIRSRGLAVLEEHFERSYATEGAEIDMILGGDDELLMVVPASPAVLHMRANGYPVAECFHETEKSVNEALVEDTPYAYEMLDYDPETGACRQRFFRRMS